MRAALLERFGAPLRVGEAPTPVAGAGEVVVRTVACGICRTDVHMQDGVAYRPQLPHILGHEPAGRIASLGAGVSGWAVGDRVAPYLFDTCGHCDACHGGSDAQCDAHPAVLGVTRNGVEIGADTGNGAAPANGAEGTNGSGKGKGKERYVPEWWAPGNPYAVRSNMGRLLLREGM